ncbi:hypothetical protein [Streptomyces collinus]
MTDRILPREHGRVHDALVLRLINKHGMRPVRAHFAVRRVALDLTPNRDTPLVHAEIQELVRESIEHAGQFMTDFMRIVAPRLKAMSEAMAQAAAALRSAGLIAEDGSPARPDPSRPAWMSPYGPPARRRRH